MREVNRSLNSRCHVRQDQQLAERETNTNAINTAELYKWFAVQRL